MTQLIVRLTFLKGFSFLARLAGNLADYSRNLEFLPLHIRFCFNVLPVFPSPLVFSPFEISAPWLDAICSLLAGGMDFNPSF